MCPWLFRLFCFYEKCWFSSQRINYMKTSICAVEFTCFQMVWYDLKKFKYEVGHILYYMMSTTMKGRINFPNITRRSL